MAPTQHTGASGRRVSASGYDITPLARAQVAELAARLSPEEYRVTQNAGTEPAFCGTLLDNKKAGTYACIVCGLPLFSSEHKFNSGTGWPSFFQPFDKDHIATVTDTSHGMVRVEIECARCSAHLGHVFDDGPAPTGQRYCLNGAALTFHDAGALPADRFTSAAAAATAGAASGASAGTAAPAVSPPAAPAAGAPANGLQTAYFAGGCFWGIEHWFGACPGVVDAVSGYMGGHMAAPTYKAVCSGATGHAETVKVVFDPEKVSYKQLLDGFFIMHNPTQLNRQGPDVGTQYRSAIYCTTPEQEKEARAAIAALREHGMYAGRTIVTEVVQGGTFYPAEEMHQDYVVTTGRACHVTNPWPKVFGAAGAAH